MVAPAEAKLQALRAKAQKGKVARPSDAAVQRLLEKVGMRSLEEALLAYITVAKRMTFDEWSAVAFALVPLASLLLLLFFELLLQSRAAGRQRLRH